MYILSTGCQWAALPKDLPPRSTVNDYMRRRTDDGTIDRIHHALYVKCREQADRNASPTAAIIDSQSVKGAEKGGARIDPAGYDAGKKRHLLVDTQGLLTAMRPEMSEWPLELGLQITALREAGVPEANIVQEKASGKAGSDRPLYAALLGRLRDGDRLVVWKVDRLGRSTLESLNTAKDLDERGVHIVITTLGIDLKTPGGRLVFGMMVQIAEFERELIRERVKAGMAVSGGGNPRLNGAA